MKSKNKINENKYKKKRDVNPKLRFYTYNSGYEALIIASKTIKKKKSPNKSNIEGCDWKKNIFKTRTKEEIIERIIVKYNIQITLNQIIRDKIEKQIKNKDQILYKYNKYRKNTKG